MSYILKAPLHIHPKHRVPLVETLGHMIVTCEVSVENRARLPARYRVKNDVGGQIRHAARPADG